MQNWSIIAKKTCTPNYDSNNSETLDYWMFVCHRRKELFAKILEFYSTPPSHRPHEHQTLLSKSFWNPSILATWISSAKFKQYANQVLTLGLKNFTSRNISRTECNNMPCNSFCRKIREFTHTHTHPTPDWLWPHWQHKILVNTVLQLNCSLSFFACSLWRVIQ